MLSMCVSVVKADVTDGGCDILNALWRRGELHAAADEQIVDVVRSGERASGSGAGEESGRVPTEPIGNFAVVDELDLGESDSEDRRGAVFWLPHDRAAEVEEFSGRVAVGELLAHFAVFLFLWVEKEEKNRYFFFCFVLVKEGRERFLDCVVK